MFNHAVREDLGAKKALDGWEPMKLTPFVEGDGNKGYGVMASIDEDAVVDEDLRAPLALSRLYSNLCLQSDTCTVFQGGSLGSGTKD